MKILGINIDKEFLKLVLFLVFVYLYAQNYLNFQNYTLLISVAIAILTANIGIIAILVIENVWSKIEDVRLSLIENIRARIRESYDKEKNLSFEKIEEKIKECEDRRRLYNELDLTKKRNMLKSAGISAILMFIVLIEVLFLKIPQKYLNSTSLFIFFIGALIFAALLIDLTIILKEVYPKKLKIKRK